MALSFNNCKNLKTIIFLNKFTIEKVEYIDRLFNYDENLVELELSHFNTENVETLSNVFANCESLISLVNILYFSTKFFKLISYKICYVKNFFTHN